jgi:hypothetical protein
LNKGFLSPWTEHPCWQKFIFPGAAIFHSYFKIWNVSPFKPPLLP